MKLASVEEMRLCDAYTIEKYVSGRTLMYRAAMALYLSDAWRGRIAIAAGSGNNGGDGWALACILKERGLDPAVYTLGPESRGDAGYFEKKARTLGVRAEKWAPGALTGADIIVDCLLGTGSKGSLRSPYDEAAAEINASGAYVISADIPSGPVRADLTVSIGFLKEGQQGLPDIIAADIGMADCCGLREVPARTVDVRGYFAPGELFPRPAVMGDMPSLLRIYAAARDFMARTGNPDQWGSTKPTEAELRQEINAGRLCILETVEGRARAAFVFFTGEDPTYKVIDGAWGTDGEYAVLHRVASDGTVGGVLAAAVRFACRHFPVIRMDTHEKNAPMQGALARSGFQYRGIIRLADGQPRLAFERVSKFR